MDFTSSTSLGEHRSPVLDVASAWVGIYSCDLAAYLLDLCYYHRANLTTKTLPTRMTRGHPNHGRVQQGGREGAARMGRGRKGEREGRRGVQVTYFCREI